jgi:hypothetical protein
LKDKLTQYRILPKHTYNMDEKGFMLGVVQETRRYFTTSQFDSKKLRGNGQDGNREWVTVLASICQDLTALPPAIVYSAATNNHMDNWYEELGTTECIAQFSTSPSGWTNDEIGYKWLTTVFDRHTKPKLRKKNDYRLLFVDGHSSHLNMRFIEFCDANRILLMFYPPHSTHRLQPLDVSLFNPLANYYSQNLSNWLITSRSICSMSKRHFWSLFWPAFQLAFTAKNIESSWRKTGLLPLNPEVVLSQVRLSPRPSSSSSSSGADTSYFGWRRAKKQLVKAYGAPRTSEQNKTVRHLEQVYHRNRELELENEELKEKLELKGKQQQRSLSLWNEIRQDDDNQALFVSPNKLHQAKTKLAEREAAKEEEEEAKRLRKVAREEKKQLEEAEAQKKRELREIAKQLRLARTAEDRRLRDEKRQQKQAEKQLSNDMKAAKKRQALPRAKKLQLIVEFESSEEVISDEETKLPPTRSGRQRTLPQRLRS